MIAEVVINRTAKKLNRTFDYAIPKELEDFVIIGSKVLVPFGKGGKLEEAFVTRIKDNTEFKVKEIAKIENSLDEKKIELAKWMANRYFYKGSQKTFLAFENTLDNIAPKYKDKFVVTANPLREKFYSIDKYIVQLNL